MRLLVTGGGTGGHLFPGIAVAQGMQERFPDCRILFIGTSRHIDQKALAAGDFKLATIDCLGIKGKSAGGKLVSLIKLPGAVFTAMNIIRGFRPHLVLGVGGYVTGPVLLAARLLNIPSCIHEQNSVPGLANRLAATIVTRIFLSLPCDGRFPVRKTILTGNPVRKAIIDAADKPKDEDRKFTILVLGGSQGAHKVNLLMLATAKLLKKEHGDHFKIIHQTGVEDHHLLHQGYKSEGIEAVVQPFFEDMARIYRQSDLGVSRAGATTLAELAVMGLPSILIPYPFAADNHQELNGRFYQAQGGVRMFREKELSSQRAAEEISSLLRNPEDLRTMSSSMKTMGKPEATEQIINQCLQLIKSA